MNFYRHTNNDINDTLAYNFQRSNHERVFDLIFKMWVPIGRLT